MQGIARLPSTDERMRTDLERELEEKGAAALHAELLQRDAKSAAAIHPNNHQRLLRALADMHDGAGIVRSMGKPRGWNP